MCSVEAGALLFYGVFGFVMLGLGSAGFALVWHLFTVRRAIKQIAQLSGKDRCV